MTRLWGLPIILTANPETTLILLSTNVKYYQTHSEKKYLSCLPLLPLQVIKDERKNMGDKMVPSE